MYKRINTIIISIGCFLLVTSGVTKILEPSLPACNSKSAHRILTNILSPKVTSVDGKYILNRTTLSSSEESRTCNVLLHFIDKEGNEVNDNFNYTIKWKDEDKEDIDVSIVD